MQHLSWFSILGLLVAVLGVVPAADVVVPLPTQMAAEAVAITGARTISPAQIRTALASTVEFRRSIRQGLAGQELAQAIAPLVLAGYRANGFAEARVEPRDGTLAITEGIQRTWRELAIIGPSPLLETRAREVVTPPAIGEQASSIGNPIGTWVSGQPASFHDQFRADVATRIAREFPVRGWAKPVVQVEVEPIGSDGARCTVRLTELPATPIRTIRIEGAIANPPATVASWLDREAGLRPGSPWQQETIDAACAKLADTGRFIQVSGRTEGKDEVVVQVLEKNGLPLLGATLTDWQQRWQDMGDQLDRLYRQGAGIDIQLDSKEAPVHAHLRLGQRVGIAVEFSEKAGNQRSLAIGWQQHRMTWTASGTPPLTWVGDGGSPTGKLAITPAKAEHEAVGLQVEIGYSTGFAAPLAWSLPLSALLSASAGEWKELPGRPGTWQRPGNEPGAVMNVTWDAQGAWREWELCKGTLVIRLSPAVTAAETAPVKPTATPVSGMVLLRAMVREPARWLPDYAKDADYDDLAGMVAGVLTPLATFLTEEAPTPSTGGAGGPNFWIPAPPEGVPTESTSLTTDRDVGLWANWLANTLATRPAGPRAWPVLLSQLAAAQYYDRDEAGVAVFRRILDQDATVGPLGRLMEVYLLKGGPHPDSAVAVAQQGLKVCTADRMWDDLRACLGSEEQLVRWFLAIEDIDQAVRLLPSTVRPGLATALRAFQGAPPASRAALARAAFQVWWDAGNGTKFRSFLQYQTKPERKKEAVAAPAPAPEPRPNF